MTIITPLAQGVIDTIQIDMDILLCSLLLQLQEKKMTPGLVAAMLGITETGVFALQRGIDLDNLVATVAANHLARSGVGYVEPEQILRAFRGTEEAIERLRQKEAENPL